MPGRIDARLADLGIALATPLTPSANYVPYVITGGLVHVSGQVARVEGGQRRIGRLGAALPLSEGQAAGRLVALNLLAQLRVACDGDLDRVDRVVKLLVFVNAAPDFGEHALVANSVSDIMVDVFGDAGRHARSAVGCASLPKGVAMEAEGVFQIR